MYCMKCDSEYVREKSSEIKTELCQFAMSCRGMQRDDLPGMSGKTLVPGHNRAWPCVNERDVREYDIRHVPVFFVRTRTTAILALKSRFLGLVRLVLRPLRISAAWIEEATGMLDRVCCGQPVRRRSPIRGN